MEPYDTLAEHYDLEHGAFHADIDLYLQLLDDGPILEVGSGTGRVMLPLAAAGFEVYGVDPSSAMRSRAAERLSGLEGAHLLSGAIQDLRIDVRFAGILFSLNSLWHLTDSASQLAGLAAARRHLLPGGVVVVDLTNPLTMADRGADGGVRCRFRRYDGERTITGFSSAWDDEAEQTLDLSLWYDELRPDGPLRRTSGHLTLRYIYRPELELLLRLAGLTPRQVYGSYDLDPYGSDSPNLIVVATAC